MDCLTQAATEVLERTVTSGMNSEAKGWGKPPNQTEV